jgi:hypothetical protein
MLRDPFKIFADANQPKEKKPKRKNSKPEKIVEGNIMAWLRFNGFDCNVVEAKAVYNPKIKRYLKSQAIPGMSDVIGNDKDGIAVYIELKAKGRLSTLAEHQKAFLLRKISTNCFACCVDSVDLIKEIYCKWKSIDNNETKRQFLTSLLEG